METKHIPKLSLPRQAQVKEGQTLNQTLLQLHYQDTISLNIKARFYYKFKEKSLV